MHDKTLYSYIVQFMTQDIICVNAEILFYYVQDISVVSFGHIASTRLHIPTEKVGRTTGIDRSPYRERPMKIFATERVQPLLGQIPLSLSQDACMHRTRLHEAIFSFINNLPADFLRICPLVSSIILIPS